MGSVLVGVFPCLSLAGVDSLPLQLSFWSSKLQLGLEGISGLRSIFFLPC